MLKAFIGPHRLLEVQGKFVVPGILTDSVQCLLRDACSKVVRLAGYNLLGGRNRGVSG